MRDPHRVFLTILAVAIPAAVVATVVCVPRATSDRAPTLHDNSRSDDPALVPIADAPPDNASRAAERDATDLALAVIDASDPEWGTFARTSFDLLHRLRTRPDSICATELFRHTGLNPGDRYVAPHSRLGLADIVRIHNDTIGRAVSSASGVASRELDALIRAEATHVTHSKHETSRAADGSLQGGYSVPLTGMTGRTDAVHRFRNGGVHTATHDQMPAFRAAKRLVDAMVIEYLRDLTFWSARANLMSVVECDRLLRSLVDAISTPIPRR